jgi:chlorite dismutase/heme-degrading monooxygenase HmoA
MERREAPPTEEGWFALHDFRTIDWDAWRDAPEREREAALTEGRAFLEAAESVEDAEEGASVTYGVTGHKADLLLVHLRETMAEVNTLERRFEGTALAGFTERTHSHVSVTEASGYTNDELDPDEIEDTGLSNYIGMRLHPTVPDAEYVCFYPMDKRRDPEQNWYDLSFEDRAEHMESHGEIGREYAGEVTQMITGSIGLDDWEWGVTLWSNDPARFKNLLYEMRFDPSTSRFAEFGPFYTGQRLPPERLGAFLAGESLDAADEHPEDNGHHGGEADTDNGHHGDEADPDSERTSEETGTTPPPETGDGIRGEFEEMDIYAGTPHGEDVYAMVLYSEADPDELFEELDGLRGNFEHYDTHVQSGVYADGRGDRSAVVSIWDTQRAAETAGGFLSDLPGVVARAGEESGFGTMGMFYTVKPDYRGEFTEKFDTVGDLLSGMDGHLDTRLMTNVEDENDMFIASQWESRNDAMAFFRSDAFADTVDWGRDVLADRPRHVFLA